MCVLCFYGNQLRCQNVMVDVLRENFGSVNDVTFVKRFSTVSSFEGEACSLRSSAAYKLNPYLP